MGMTDIERRALKGGAGLPGVPALTEPLAVRLAEAVRISGFSRSDLYRRAARGEIIFRKAGGRILVEYAGLKAAIMALPVATINIDA
jgi:hypothetical protein